MKTTEKLAISLALAATGENLNADILNDDIATARTCKNSVQILQALEEFEKKDVPKTRVIRSYIENANAGSAELSFTAFAKWKKVI